MGLFFDNKNHEPFVKETEVKLCLRYLDKWASYNPEDGVFDYTPNDMLSVCHFLTKIKDDYIYTIIKPELLESADDKWKEEFYLVRIFRTKIDDLWYLANDFNKISFAYKCGSLTLDDECIFNLVNEEIAKERIDNESDCDKIVVKFLAEYLHM